MRTHTTFLILFACIGTTGGDALYAQGRGAGRGLGKAASNAAAASGSTVGRSGLNAATHSVAAGGEANKIGANRAANSVAQIAGRGSAALPNDLSQISGIAAGASRGARGLKQSRPALPGSLPHSAFGGPSDASPNVWERIQQKRISQAEHLRGISERNGNESLLITAERMEASALQNFQRQSATSAGAAAQYPDRPPVAAAASATNAAAGRQVTPAKRGFWFRSR